MTTTAQLLARAAQGDVTAFEQLYDDTAPLVYGLVLRVVRDPALAEQVTREVFVQAWRRAAHYDAAAGSALAWLTASAHRHAVDSVRRSDVAPRPAGLPAAVPEPAPVSPSAVRTRAALERLVPAQREALELAYLGGYTHTEVGLMLDPPSVDAAALLRDGLRELRVLLGDGQSPTASMPRWTTRGSGRPTMSPSLPS